jgi:RNA polymerase sigma factor (sigma-70 family)
MKDKKRDRRFGDHFVDNYNCSLSYRRKKRGRIRYLGWATELYGCLDEEIEKRILQDLSTSNGSSESSETIDLEVRKAVEKLYPTEKRFVQLFYFEFKSYQQIARILKKKVYKLERVHQRALSKLRIILADFVKERFKLQIPERTDCIICKSPFRWELDQLIRDKKKEETYASLIRIFKQKYGIHIKTPQIIIGHKRKHMV